jgi:hypothetical protein
MNQVDDVQGVDENQLIEENVQRVEQMLDSDLPPTHAIGDTTDYRQVISAWSKKHGLSFEEMIQTLETSGGEEGQRLVDEIRRNPETEEAFRVGLAEPLTGDLPTSVADDAQHVEQVHLDDMHPR